MVKSRNKPKVFVDADVIFAGAAAPTEHGASHVILRMGEITLIDCISSEQAVKEVERNLAEKIPDILVEFLPNAKIGLFQFARLQRFLSELLECKVDLATPDALHKHLKEDILKEAIHAA